MNSRELDRDLEGCVASHRRLTDAIDGLTDSIARQPSLLPGWSVGHVLTHLARNADSHVRMLQGAERGEVLTQYEFGAEGREADIEVGAGRPADEIVADVRRSTDRLERTWAATTDRGWLGRGIALRGELPNVALPYRRWVESEVHHIDLGVLTTGADDRGYTFADLPSDFVGLELRRLTASWASRQPMGLTDLPDAALRLTVPDRLGWLLGRLNIDGLAPAGVFG